MAHWIDDRMVSKVKAGTIIIEDTRGLHKAGIPKKAYRDLGSRYFTTEYVTQNHTALSY